MTKKLVTLILCLSGLLAAAAQTRRWTVADGLPTGEVHQIVELPNGQMLVNCESVFCLSNGRGFLPVPCDYSRAYRLSHYGGGYAHQWQGDSLLWLQDFYRIYLFDARTRSFRYDHEQRLPEGLMRGFKPSPLTVTDRQGGLWRATRQDGIVYQPPTRRLAERIDGPHPLIDLARSEKGVLSLRELQERAHVSQPTMWGIVRRLEEKGLVASETAGARAKSVHLTEEGERVAVCGRAFADEEERRLLDALDADERETFARLLAKVCAAL